MNVTPEMVQELFGVLYKHMPDGVKQRALVDSLQEAQLDNAPLSEQYKTLLQYVMDGIQFGNW